MPRLTKLERKAVLDCLIFQECNDGDARPWGSSNDNELTERQRGKMDAAMLSAIEKFKESD